METVRDYLTSKGKEAHFFSPAVRVVIVWVLFLASFALRTYAITEPPLEFNPIRQYRYLLVARAYYFESIPSIPDWKRQVATINQQDLSILEPPIMPYLAYLGYRLAGAEHVWIPRMMSVVCWLIGGIFLYRISRRIISADGALFSVAFYLFLPFGIFASRSFQPDPLMLMLLLASLYSMLRYYEQPSFKTLWIVAAASGLAVLAKPTSVFFILGGFLSLAHLEERSWRRALTRPPLLLFLLLTALPLLTYYFYGIFVSDFLRQQAEYSFVPSLILHWFFWRSWFDLIRTVIGGAPLILGFLGVLTLGDKKAKTFLTGLWVGYIVFGLVFTNHIHTHNYYHLPFIPVIALSCGALGALIIERLNEASTEWHWRAAAWCALIMGLLLPILEYTEARRLLPDFDKPAKIARETGEAVAHSTKTLLLSSRYERAVRYHGELYGVTWPGKDERHWEELSTDRRVGAEERLRSLLSSYPADYFVVTDIGEFERQQDLKQLLTLKFPILQENSGYVIFDLRKNHR